MSALNHEETLTASATSIKGPFTQCDLRLSQMILEGNERNIVNSLDVNQTFTTFGDQRRAASKCNTQDDYPHLHTNQPGCVIK